MAPAKMAKKRKDDGLEVSDDEDGVMRKEVRLVAAHISSLYLNNTQWSKQRRMGRKLRNNFQSGRQKKNE